MVVCADDLAAAEYCSRLPFGAGRPVRLDEESATGLARRRREGAQEAEQAPGKFYRQDGITDPIARPHGVEPVVQLPAVNTEHRPWASPGGIAGARCPSFADAAHVREVIVSEHLHQMEGMVVVFGDAQAAVVAVVADTPETSQLAHESLLRLAGNLSYEPSPEEILGILLPRFLEFQMYRVVLESQAAFFAAQMTAMDSASKNAGDMIDSLTLIYNRARQARITKELIEIVSGAAALG